jgi:hypothetical protein
MRTYALLLLSIVAGGCAPESGRGLDQCTGVFSFEDIDDQALREDARRILIEFANIDPNVTADFDRLDGGGPVVIRGRGEQCGIFGKSFLDSDMPQFTRLRYEEGGN